MTISGLVYDADLQQLVNDPGYQQGDGFKYGMNKTEAARERKRLFKIIEDLVLWDNTNNEEVLERARAEIFRSWREVCELNKNHPQAEDLFNPLKLPALYDPFAGGGSIPLEAQRLGLEAYASDLNPVAVLINKALIEIPPKFAGRPPVRPKDEKAKSSYDWKGAAGLAEDVRYYGLWMREEAQKRIGHLYPTIEITEEMAKERSDLKSLIGQKLTVIAWLWARTVKSPNPVFSHVDVPLVFSFVLSSKNGKEAYVQPVVDGDRYHFTVKMGTPPVGAENGTKIARGSFGCLLSGVPMNYAYIDSEANANRMGNKLMAIVAQGTRNRIYLSPTQEMEELALQANPIGKPDTPCRGTFASNAQGRIYGFKVFGDYFTPRQLLAMTTLSNLVIETRNKVREDAHSAGMTDDGCGLESGGIGATAYAEAISVYLAFALDRLAMTNNSLVRWNGVGEKAQHCFGQQGLAMLWGFAEPNVLGNATGCIDAAVFYSYDPLNWMPKSGIGKAGQADAQTISNLTNKIISTDPPYFNNVSYADLSDFFYVWLRMTLRSIFPSLLATITVPKEEELVATHYRHGSKEEAEKFFLNGMTQAISNLSRQAHPEGPITIFYAFKQSEIISYSDTGSSGWETFLEAVNQSGLQISGTWPLRTEMRTRQTAMDTNALASSIILVCRKRPLDALTISRREFIRELNSVLPDALDEMTKGSGEDRSPVAPVDLSQAIIGPGMAVFSKHTAVLEADGSPMTVRTALQLINRFLAEDDFDPDTQFCLHWFEQYGWNEGRFGDADTLSRAKGTSVDGVRNAGVLESGGGIVRLLKWSEYPTDWNPQADKRIPVWESLHHLIRAHKQAGDTEAGTLLSMIKNQGEAVRQLAYRLYTLCERKGWAEDARAYNELITSWSGIEAASGEIPEATALPIQTELFGES